MDRGGAQARRDPRGQGARLAARHRHGRRDGAARRDRRLLRVRGRARHHQGQPRADQLLRRPAQEHDARLPGRPQQARAQRRLPPPLHGRPQAHPAEGRHRRPDVRERHEGRRHRRHDVSHPAMARAGRRPLHRHRQLQRHARSRRGLGQLRHLPGDDPRQDVARLLHLARQARPHHARQVHGAEASRCRSRSWRAATRCRS